jgi:hypothetical protein
MIPKQAGFYGKPFKASRGVQQGDIVSPMIFTSGGQMSPYGQYFNLENS